MLCSLLVWYKFGRGQHRFALLRRGIKVYVDAGTTVVHSCVKYELTHTWCNNTDGVRDISYVVANVLRWQSPCQLTIAEVI